MRYEIRYKIRYEIRYKIGYEIRYKLRYKLRSKVPEIRNQIARGSQVQIAGEPTGGDWGNRREPPAVPAL